ncbi:hypothetical protein ACJX0J_031102, partial [Zea mays]
YNYSYMEAHVAMNTRIRANGNFWSDCHFRRFFFLIDEQPNAGYSATATFTQELDSSIVRIADLESALSAHVELH